MRGPFCKYSRTLPCNFPITNGEAIVVDPCYWTPTLPFRYEVKVKVQTAEGTSEHEFLWGIRRCLPQKNQLRLDGKGTVIRAIEPADGHIDLAELRSLSSSLLTHQPLEPAVYQQASELGVMVIDASPSVLDSQDRTVVQRETSVHFRSSVPLPTDIVSLSRYPKVDGRVVLIEEEELPSFDFATFQRPVFVERRIAPASLADMRKTCDWLQRDLAGLGQFAGYLVSLHT